MARLSGKSKISKDEISQEINLKRLIGQEPTDQQKRLFADLAIELINQRTLSGKSVSGSNFKKYSKAYAELKGVTRDNVDLFLSGGMLNSIKRDQSSEDASRVKLTIEKGIETLKAYNHQVGDTLPKRPFFGITSSEAKEIANQLPTAPNRDQQSFSFASLLEAAAAINRTDTGISNE